MTDLESSLGREKTVESHSGAVGYALSVGDTLGQLPAINERLAVAVKAERENGIKMVKSVLDRVREGK